MIDLDPKWDRNKRRNEDSVLADLIRIADMSSTTRMRIVRNATSIVEQIRSDSKPGMMDVFLSEFGLSTEEGVALMCLAEALLRVPDIPTIDALIEDKIASSEWSSHIGKSASPLVNASTWGLMLTGTILNDEQPGIVGHLRGMIKRLGEPVIRVAVGRALKEMGRQFVLGQNIGEAMERAQTHESKGYTYSYDMLGEAALTAEDATRYAQAYSDAIDAISRNCAHTAISQNPGISVKLSALHPRYEVTQTKRVMEEIVPVIVRLAQKAASANMGFNIDAEEMDRLGLSLKVIEALFQEPSLKDWDGLGIVVQAYGRRGLDVIRGLYEMGKRYDRRFMVRLVKGAYWDTEIKHAQTEGLTDFPVFTRKSASDVSFIALAKELLSMTELVYPQFATHNAHSVAAVLEMAKDLSPDQFEFQRLHGMGDALHSVILEEHKTRCRIYAPVGAHKDLLAYLARRLLENGANSSFVNQILNKEIAPDYVAACPFGKLLEKRSKDEPSLKKGPELFAPERRNSKGFDLNDIQDLSAIFDAREMPANLEVNPIIAGQPTGQEFQPILSPTTGEQIGRVAFANPSDVETALNYARVWNEDPEKRAEILNRTADLFEQDFGEAFAILAHEAGKTLADAVSELREAVDFLRYYSAGLSETAAKPRGIITCISPWNFPLAIFTGQISAALAAGNSVLAKPAETTNLIAKWAIEKFHEAGVPFTALQLLPGTGVSVGTLLTSDHRVNGVAFTGSTQTAKQIQKAIAKHCQPGTPLIAETGGLNAMVVDSTALLEQAVYDVVASAFQSAGQRCSALRCLYVQEDILDDFQAMLIGAMKELVLGDPWNIETDIGPVITAEAAKKFKDYIESANKEGRLTYKNEAPSNGNFVPPTIISVSGISDIKEEVFGPILHIAPFRSEELDQVIDDINATGFGLTFGLHTRINARIQMISDRVKAGNLYANRNQIGAIVGSQPFGGEGLSGTGPKAGGPFYRSRFSKVPYIEAQIAKPAFCDEQAEPALDEAKDQTGEYSRTLLPGPTGEINQLSTYPRKPLLCVGPGERAISKQIGAVNALGAQALGVADLKDALQRIREHDIGGVLWWGDDETGHLFANALSDRPGPIIPLITDMPDRGHALIERHLCVDATAAGGNASLMSGSEG